MTGSVLISLGWWELTLAGFLVVALAGVVIVEKLGVGRSLLIAAVRTTIQLLLVGLVLRWVFEVATLPWIGAMAVVMLLAAAREVVARQERPFRGWWSYYTGGTAMLISSFTVTLFALIVIIQPEPWYKPQYVIPLLGMLLGNTMTGIAIALERLTTGAANQRNRIEARLAMGHSATQAVAGLRREATRAGLIPIINAMAAAGIISLPGMMTGQILSGTEPVEAVKYQILIMFLIAAGTGFGVLGSLYLASRRLFDERERLRLDRLR